VALRQDASTGEIRDDGKPVENAAADPKKPTMHIKVYAPFKVYYEGEGYSITAVNESGPFDILPKHHNFLCMLLPCDIVIQTPYEIRKVKVTRALMHVKADEVTVFVDV
jgi:F0F1-type ATP synthase epsilon subunit